MKVTVEAGVFLPADLGLADRGAACLGPAVLWSILGSAPKVEKIPHCL